MIVDDSAERSESLMITFSADMQTLGMSTYMSVQILWAYDAGVRQAFYNKFKVALNMIMELQIFCNF
jgi:hypothetical protein